MPGVELGSNQTALALEHACSVLLPPGSALALLLRAAVLLVPAVAYTVALELLVAAHSRSACLLADLVKLASSGRQPVLVVGIVLARLHWACSQVAQ